MADCEFSVWMVAKTINVSLRTLKQEVKAQAQSAAGYLAVKRLAYYTAFTDVM